MRFKRKLGILLLLFSSVLIFSNFPLNLTGNFVQNYFNNFTFTHIIGLIILMLSFILLIQKDRLEYLVIPVGLEKWQKPKAKSARETIKSGHIDRVVITGDIDGEKRRYKEHEESKPSVYDAVRKSGIRPGQVRLLRGRDSEEDILYLGGMVKQGDTIYFDTFPLHYQEYRTLIRKAQRDGKFPQNVNLRNAKIPQGRTEIIYGLLGLGEEVLKRRPLSYKTERENSFLDSVKSKVKRLIGA